MEILNASLTSSGATFIQRAVCREIFAMQMGAKPIGSVPIEAEVWAKEWSISVDEIWKAIDLLVANDFWECQGTAQGSILSCSALITEAKTVRKGVKKSQMAKIRQDAVREVASQLSLGTVGKSITGEVLLSIPQAERKTALAGGYPGWLPCKGFSIHGTAYKPDAGLIEALNAEYPDADINQAFAAMFGDLRSSGDRPDIRSVSVWVRKWLDGNKGSVLKAKDNDTLLADLLSDTSRAY
ncbi:hypothetical protein ACYPKM_03090 [Pseudomonas aeruginosa]